MRSDSELKVITVSQKLLFYILNATENSPKKFRGTLIAKMVNLSVDILEMLITANELRIDVLVEKSQRLALQRSAIAKLKVLDVICLISQERECILPKQFEVMSRYISDCINLTGAWIKSDRLRLSNLTGKGVQL